MISNSLRHFSLFCDFVLVLSKYKTVFAFEKKIHTVLYLKKEENIKNSNQKFYSWLIHNKVHVCNKSSWMRSPHNCLISNETTDEGEPSGRGLIACKNISQGEELIQIPENVIIKRQEIKANKVGFFLNEYDFLAVFLIQQKLIGNKSKWKSYINIFPFEKDLNLIFRWRKCDVIFLKGANVLKALLHLKKKIIHRFAAVKNIFIRSSLMFPENCFNLQSWEWSLVIIFSRAILLENSASIGLVPYVDFLNHNPFSIFYTDTKKIVFSEKREVVVYSDKNVDKYEQIFINYGPKTNLELITLYGFVLEKNPFDSVEIKLSISPKDKIFFEKKKFFLETSSFVFPIFFSRYPREFLEFLKICSIAPCDLDKTSLKKFNYKDEKNIYIQIATKIGIIFLCKNYIKRHFRIFEVVNIFNFMTNQSTVTRNQKIALKQINCEKKILNKLQLGFIEI